MISYLFNNWEVLGRILVVGVLAYLGLWVMLRLGGKRTLATMNTFDFVGNVALGSTLAGVLLTPTIALAEGLAAYFVLIGLQMLINWLASHSHKVSSIINADPTLLFYRGTFLREAMRAERVTREEVLTAIRNDGIAAVEDVEAVILEVDGNFSVVSKRQPGPPTALADVMDHPTPSPLGEQSELLPTERARELAEQVERETTLYADR